jgi:hypothetical protein
VCLYNSVIRRYVGCAVGMMPRIMEVRQLLFVHLFICCYLEGSVPGRGALSLGLKSRLSLQAREGRSKEHYLLLLFIYCCWGSADSGRGCLSLGARSSGLSLSSGSLFTRLLLLLFCLGRGSGGGCLWHMDSADTVCPQFLDGLQARADWAGTDWRRLGQRRKEVFLDLSLSVEPYSTCLKSVVWDGEMHHYGDQQAGAWLWLSRDWDLARKSGIWTCRREVMWIRGHHSNIYSGCSVGIGMWLKGSKYDAAWTPLHACAQAGGAPPWWCCAKCVRPSSPNGTWSRYSVVRVNLDGVNEGWLGLAGGSFWRRGISLPHSPSHPTTPHCAVLPSYQDPHVAWICIVCVACHPTLQPSTNPITILPSARQLGTSL